MKKLLSGFAFLAFSTLTTVSAIADGMPRGGSIKDAPSGPSCGTSAFNWNGAFAGVQLGTANFRSAVTAEDILNIAGQREESGFTVGGVVGYNWQRCNTVFGIEADLAWTNIDRSWGVNPALIGGGFTFNARSQMDLYGSVKMRTGFAFDNLLLYLTGGFAFGSIDHRGSLNVPGVGQILSFKGSDTRLGWVVGAGTEYALTNRITWRSEATYTRFEDKDFNVNFNQAILPGTPPIKLNAQDEVWMLRTGINFKF